MMPTETVDCGGEAVEALAKRLKAIDWRDGCLMERACATLRALLARAGAAEENVSKMREAAERAVERTRTELDAAIAERDGLRVYTHEKQPTDSVPVWRMGEACAKAAADPKCGDYIDRGLILLRELQARGFGIAALAQEALKP